MQLTPFSKVQVISRLRRCGLAPVLVRGGGSLLRTIDYREVSKGIKALQTLHGLPAIGFVDAPTERMLAAPRPCSLPDMLLGMGTDGPIGLYSAAHRRGIAWSVSSSWGGLHRDEVIIAIARAWMQWRDVCAIDPYFTEEETNSAVRFEYGLIDRRGGVLAQTPMSSNWPKTVTFDAYESFVISEDPPQFYVDLYRTALHEIGHVLGIGHLPAGNLMQPLYSHLNVLRPGDIEAAQQRWGV